MRIVIAGGGDLGRQIARDLSEAGGNEVIILDSDESVAGELADDFDALVLHGDATDPKILKKAELDQADALVITTGSDATNTVIAMLGHRGGVEKIIVKLRSNALRGALEEIGVSDVVAPTMAAAARVEAALHDDSRLDLNEMVQGQLQLGQVTAGSHAEGQTLEELGLPEAAVVVAVVRDGEAALGRPDYCLAEGDAVVVVAESEDAFGRCRGAIEG